MIMADCVTILPGRIRMERKDMGGQKTRQRIIASAPTVTLVNNALTQIEYLRYFPRLIFITFMAALNTIGAVADWFFYGAKVRAQELNDEPVFVLGHPRTGTTHLHNLLSKDPRFAYRAPSPTAAVTVNIPEGVGRELHF